MENVIDDKIELKIINEVKDDLNKIGTCQILYLTAELQPFSNQFKPDLLFDSLLENKTLFIEFKYSLREIFKKNIFNNLLENKAFVESSIKTNFIYIFLTGANIDNKLIEKSRKENIYILDKIRDADSFYTAISSFDKQ